MTTGGWVRSVIAGLTVAAALTACSGSSDPVAGRLVVDGQAELNRPGRDRRDVTGSYGLKLGDRVRIREGTAVIRLPDDRRLELRSGTDVELQEGDASTARPALFAGDLLVVSGPKSVAVTLGGSEVAVQGDARVSRGVAVLVAAYAGTAQLTSAGSTLAVPALRQAALPATGQFPPKATPLEYSASDDWDRRYLSDAMDLSNRLAARSEGFTAQLAAGDGRTVQYFRDLVPRLAAEPTFTASLLNPARPQGETLVGAAITLEGTRGTFVERWASVFAFRDQGAPWGLVALDQGVDRAPVLALVEAALSRGPREFAEGPPTRTPSSLPRPSASTATTVAPAPTTTVRPRPGVTTTTVPATPTTSTTVPGPLNTGAPLIDNTVNSLVNTLNGILRGLGSP